MMQLVDDGFTIDDNLTVEDASGHSEGHVVIRATSAGQGGFFIGDLMHTPLQVPYPDVNSIYCQFPERARAARRRVLEDCAEHGHFLLPAHFTSPYIGRVAADGDAFRFLPGR
jgi:glyoxylase-like metal-dependent hydrolase (beta-lactamase superfamily II)